MDYCKQQELKRQENAEKLARGKIGDYVRFNYYNMDDEDVTAIGEIVKPGSNPTVKIFHSGGKRLSSSEQYETQITGYYLDYATLNPKDYIKRIITANNKKIEALQKENSKLERMIGE